MPPSPPDFAFRESIETVARDQFGWPAMRPGQVDAINSVLSGTDTLVVMPTGRGKSAIYQIAGALTPGVVVVVSPLISLQSDQVAGLATRPRAPQAVAVNSSHGDAKNERAWNAVASGDATFLFLSPEQLAKEEVLGRLANLDVRLFVVDEAHTVSAWGHDFRPDYLRLGEVIDRLGHPTTLALTATGSPPVRDEIVERLAMRDARVMTFGFDRPNLHLRVERHEEERQKHHEILEQLPTLARPGLLYVGTHRDADTYARELAGGGMRALAYHAGLASSVRERVHESFTSGDTDVVVATNAFGMGIDKADVRFVVHEAIPESLESYYQEIGRAGRDGNPAAVTLHYRAEDIGMKTFFASGLPHQGQLVALYATLLAATGPVTITELSEELGEGTQSVSRHVNLFEIAQVADTDRRGVRAVADETGVIPDAAAAASRAYTVAQERERIEHSRITMMREYAETRQCRRQFLLGYFGEDLPEPCGNCDTCESGSAYEEYGEYGERGATAQAGPDVFADGTEVVHPVWGEGVVMRNEDDRITVFFESEGYKVLSREVVEERGLLTAIDPPDTPGQAAS